MIRRALRQLVALLAIALAPALVSSAWQLRWGGGSAAGDLREVTRAEVEQWREAVLWVDARSREQFERSRVPGAVLLNESEWNACVPLFLDAWKPEMWIVVYDDTGAGAASREVARRLHDELELQNVWVLKGDVDAWQK